MNKTNFVRTKKWLMYSVVWICGVTAGASLHGWWWLIPAVISVVGYYLIDYLMRE